MKRRHQPFFFPLLLLAAGALVNPSSHVLAGVLEASYRTWFNAASIVLAAAPFVLAGAIGAYAVARLHVRGAVALLAAAFAPGCDCSMNGFAAALTRNPAPLAGAVLVWGAACNPVALATTAAVLGTHLALARAAGGAVTALALWLLWNHARDAKGAVETRRTGDPHAHCAAAVSVAVHLERGLRALMPAAAFGALLPLFLGGFARHASPLVAAMFAVVLSPCSSADPILARVLTRGAPAQAVFMIASQCLDVRQLALLWRTFGPRRTLLAVVAGIGGCVTAALAAG